MSKATVFVSHITEEAALARLLKDELVTDFLGLLEVFVSSDTESITAGDRWLPSIEEALRRASVQIILCSPASVGRPWINFEAGAAWMREIPVIPVCHTGLEPRDLPMPLAALQGVRAAEVAGLEQIYVRVASVMGAQLPRTDVISIAQRVQEFEARYRTQISPAIVSRVEQNRLALQRMKDLLGDPKFRYRRVERLAEVAAISESDALDLLRADGDVVFSRNRESGATIARLRSRQAAPNPGPPADR